MLENGVWTLLARDVLGGATFTFGGEGVARFVVQGIEPGAGLDPGDPTAFVTALAFAADGTFNGRMVPLLQAVPEPQTYALLAAGLGVVGWIVRRRRRGT